ncbi:MAG: TolC family protein [Saprospiraceae bacterium]|nr:TolC family protein [Saprospiraceae bacterium]
MLRILFISTIFALAANLLPAQQTDYDAIIQPVDAKARDIGEYMVQLAWLNSPEGRIAEYELLNARSENKNTRKEWMRDVNASFNFNESNLKGADTLGNVFFPRYNFGVTLNLYNILSQKEKNNIGRRRMTIADERIHQRKREIRADALTAWANFRLVREIFKERSTVELDLNNNFILIQQLYKGDEATLEQYTTTSATYYQAREARIRSQTEAEIAKFKLEEIIGLRWEQVQHPSKED